MKKVLLFAPIIAGAMLFSCGKKTEVTPVPDPVKIKNQPKVTVTFTGADFAILKKDFNVSTLVSTADDTTAWIILDVTGTEKTGAIYMLYQKDGAKAVKWNSNTKLTGKNPTDTTKTAVFDPGKNDYSYNVPKELNISYKLFIPVKVRKETSAITDVFTLWITKDGKAGRFDNPAKNLAYGVATITFNYTNEKLVNFYETTLGSSANTAVGSLFSTTVGSNFTRPYANDTVPSYAKTVDFVFNNSPAGTFSFGSLFTKTLTDTTAAIGTVTNSSITTGFKGVSSGKYLWINNLRNVTMVAMTDMTAADFTAIVGEASLTTAVNKVISATTTTTAISYTAVPTGKVFAFKTSAGKIGLVRVVSLDQPDGTNTTAMLEVKVQR